MAELTIWNWVVTDDLDALFLAVVRAPEDRFEAAAAPYLDSIPVPEMQSDEDLIEQAIANIESLKLPEETKAGLIAEIRATFAEDDGEDWDEEDDDEAYDEEDPTFPMPSRREIPLAESHMFFDDPYASLGYDEIERQESECMQRYREAVSRAVGGPGESFAAYIGATDALLNDDANYDFFERFAVDGFEWVWQTPEAVFFLVHDHEDKELPIHLSFGRASPVDFAALRAHILAAL